MYPFAMKECIFPNPAKLKKRTNPTLEKLLYDLEYCEGMAKISVIHKDISLGFLPLRTDDKLIFPVGKFTGTWNFPEIRYALKNKIIKITEVHEIISAPPYPSPFSGFVDDLYAKRKASTGIYNTIYKLILNSLYGKFAQRINFEQTYYDEIPYDIARNLRDRGIDFNIQLFNKTRNDCFLQIKKVGHLHHTIPVFSSYITSFSRVLLLDYLYDNIENLVYCDTDSLCLDVERNYDSQELGKLKRENQIIIEIYGNKSYRESDGKSTFLKMKGVPQKAEQVTIKEYNYLKMTKTKEGLRRNSEPGHFRSINKKLTFKYEKRLVNPDGTTKPIKL